MQFIAPVTDSVWIHSPTLSPANSLLLSTAVLKDEAQQHDEDAQEIKNGPHSPHNQLLFHILRTHTGNVSVGDHVARSDRRDALGCFNCDDLEKNVS